MPIDEVFVAQLAAGDPMLTKLLAFCTAHDEIRSAVLNGSRANPNAPRDRWQDYDINMAERTPGYFLQHPEFLDQFGKRVIMQKTHGYQTPTGWMDASEEEYQTFVATGNAPGIHHYNLMIIYDDGVRVDFSFVPADRAAETYTDSMTIPLLDKDGIIPALPPTSDAGYLVQKPSPARFGEVCNELFWLSTYVAKGLLRGEIVSAQSLMNVQREQLIELLTWQIGVRTGWSVNPGYRGKWLQRFLTEAEWQGLLATYANAEIEAQWRALLAATTLAREVGVPLAAALGEEYLYDHEEDARTVAYLHRLHAQQGSL